MKRVTTGCLLPTLVVVLAAGTGAGMFLAGQKAPQQREVQTTLPAVDVVSVTRGEIPLDLLRVGEVRAAQEVDVTTEVGGTLSWVMPGLHAGVRVAEGEVVARLDPTAFDASVAAAQATLASAEQALALELGQGDVASLEATLVGSVNGGNPALMRREPQLATARADVASAQAALASAKRDRRLASLRAPFDAVLVEETLDPGRLVQAGTALGRWIGTSRAEVEVSVPLGATGWFDRDDLQVEVRSQGSDVVRTAQSVGLTGVVDSATRTARLLVVVDRPYDTSEGPPLLPGSFAEVRVVGGPATDASRLPDQALVDGSFVWSVTPDDTLKKVPVQVLWRSGNEVIVHGDPDLTRVVARPTGTLLDGRAVRVRAGEG